MGVNAALRTIGIGHKKKAATPAADIQSQLAQQLFQDTDPLRKALIGRSADFLSSGVTASPAYGSLKDTVGDQFAAARDATISATPEGGGLTAELARLQGQEASAMTQGVGDIYGRETDLATALATGGANTAMSGLGSAAATQAATAQAKATQNAGKSAAVGTGLGAVLGSK